MLLFYFFAAIVIWQGVMSLNGGRRFHAYVRREMAKPPSDYAPYVSLVAPCRGLDQGLSENLSALFELDYPAFEIIFVTDSELDPALPIIELVRRQFQNKASIRSRVVIAGEATDSGQKVHNLQAALRQASSNSEVFVFVDTDARPSSGWMRSLVAPLENENMGAATGYRWFVPASGGFSSHLRAVWNGSIASALGSNGEKNFCWGGATAIRRSTFEKIGMADLWRGTVSDDFAMMRALRSAGLPIYFVPACLTASIEDCGFSELIEFTTRQLKITRVYAPGFWKAVLVGSLLVVSVFFGGLVLVFARMSMGLSFLLPAALLLVIFLLGAAKAWIRLRAVMLPLRLYENQLKMGALPHLIFWPLTSAIYLYNAICAAFSRRIAWRGIVYELKSPNETVIIKLSDRL
jgi:hypothetical protein